MINNFPKKTQLLLNFLSCTSWEEKYIYIIDLGKLLPKFPTNIRTKKEFLISECQSQTWIALTIPFSKNNNQHFSIHQINIIKLHGDSDSSIVKGLITIIFGLYQELTLQEMIDFNPRPFFEQLQLQQNLTTSRSQGIHTILRSIHIQSKNLKTKILQNTFKSNLLLK